jgi:NitT/TauT family transport system substrate-binding protein
MLQRPWSFLRRSVSHRSGRLLAILLMVAVCGCGNSGSAGGTKSGGAPSGDAPVDTARQKLSLALNWYPEVEHGGFIAAKTLGLFDAEQLDVEIVPGGPGAPQLVISELAAGRIEFAVSDADNVVKARAAGLPIVALMAPLQNSPRCIMVHAAAGFRTLHDLADIELAIAETRPFALWMKKELPLRNVTIIPFNGLVGEFLQKPNYAQQAFVFSEPFLARELGGDPQSLMVSDIGFNPYASVLITTESILRDSPQLAAAMVRACVDGWRRYLADPDATNSVIGTMNAQMTPAALKFGSTAMAPLCQPEPGQTVCGMTLERWQTLVTQILELEGAGDTPVKAEDCFTTKFLTMPAQDTP